MLLLRGALFGLVCGAIGAAVWAAVAYLGGLEHGLTSTIVELSLMITVGGLAGFGMGMGNRGRGGAGAGIVAGFVAFLSVVGGKFAVSQVTLDSIIHDAGLAFDEESALDAMAGQVYQEFDAAGRDMGEEGEDWPSAVWAETCARWQSMSAGDRAQYTADLQAEYQQGMEAARPVVGALAFVFSFGLYDLLWFALAATTAFTIGATDLKAKQAEQALLAGTAEADRSARPAEYSSGPSAASLGIFGSLGREESAPGPSTQSSRRREAA